VGATTHEMESRLANLQFENQRLRNTRAQAAGRLTVLIERLQQESETASPETLTDTLVTLKQDTAA